MNAMLVLFTLVAHPAHANPAAAAACPATTTKAYLSPAGCDGLNINIYTTNGFCDPVAGISWPCQFDFYYDWDVGNPQNCYITDKTGQPLLNLGDELQGVESYDLDCGTSQLVIISAPDTGERTPVLLDCGYDQCLQVEPEDEVPVHE